MDSMGLYIFLPAEKIAIDMDTNISDLFRGFLADLTSREGSRREFLADELDRLFEKSSGRVRGSQSPESFSESGMKE